MTAAGIIYLIICFLTAAIMIGIGISQLKSTSPVGFYTGEKPPGEDELTDVQEWNKRHGRMWLAYGIVIIISSFAGYIIADSILSVILACGGFLAPLIVMIWYHHKLIEKYKR